MARKTLEEYWDAPAVLVLRMTIDGDFNVLYSTARGTLVAYPNASLSVAL